jgi:hypothetical protein
MQPASKTCLGLRHVQIPCHGESPLGITLLMHVGQHSVPFHIFLVEGRGSWRGVSPPDSSWLLYVMHAMVWQEGRACLTKCGATLAVARRGLVCPE